MHATTTILSRDSRSNRDRTARPILGGLADLADVEESGPSRRRSILILAAGLTLIATGLLSTLQTIDSYLSTPRFDTPGTTVIDLPTGRYTMFSSTRTGDRRSAFDARSVSVTEAATGREVPVVAGGAPQLAVFDSEVYVSVATVEIDTESGQIAVRVDGDLPARAVLVRNRTNELVGAQRAFSLMGAGGIVAAAGVAMWVTGVRRRRERAEELLIAAHFDRIPDPS